MEIISKLTDSDKKRVLLDPTLKSDFIHQLETKLKKQVVGQDAAIEHIVNAVDRVIAGIKNKEKPVLTMLFLGPTGTGKTETVKVLSEVIFGKRDSFLRINCEEFVSDHMVARLFGSPPGYVGNEVEPMLSQKNIDKFCKKAIEEESGLLSPSNKWGKKLYDVEKEDYLSIVLFDEIEKAHPKIWTSLLSIMDDGHLVLGKNEEVSLRNCIVIMTTNVGSKEIDKTLKGTSIGFEVTDESERSNITTNKAIDEIKDFFPPEFCNRFDEIIPFKSLTTKEIEQIIAIQLKYFFKDLVEAKVPLYIRYSKEFIEYIAKEGFNKQYGARHLNRVIKNRLITPISKLLTTNQIIPGDVLSIDYSKSSVTFMREPRTEEQIKKLYDGQNPKSESNKNKKIIKKKVSKK